MVGARVGWGIGRKEKKKGVKPRLGKGTKGCNSSNRQDRDKRKTVIKYLSDKGLVPRMYKELLKLINKDKKPQFWGSEGKEAFLLWCNRISGVSAASGCRFEPQPTIMG